MLGLGAGKAFLEEDLSNITCLVHINIGAEDEMVSIEESKAVADALPNATFTVIEGAKHPIDLLSPDQIEEVVEGELTKTK